MADALVGEGPSTSRLSQKSSSGAIARMGLRPHPHPLPLGEGTSETGSFTRNDYRPDSTPRYSIFEPTNREMARAVGSTWTLITAGLPEAKARSSAGAI